jgi:hypothetical protein
MRTVRAALFALALSLVAAPAFAQGFLKIDGVEGESADDKHKLEIDIDSVTVKGQDLHIVKKIDKASPERRRRSRAPSSWCSTSRTSGSTASRRSSSRSF